MSIEFSENFPLNNQQVQGALDKLAEPKGRSAFYLNSYPHLVSVVARLDRTRKDSDVCLAHLAYGWMPTALTRVELSRFHNNDTTLLSELTELCPAAVGHFLHSFSKAPINDSWVGTSKAFHFARPDLFPIWDSRIAGLLGASQHYQVAAEGVYETYVLKVVSWAKEQPQLADWVAQSLGYTVSAVRALELVLFTAGQE